jgi:hypothetical protein
MMNAAVKLMSNTIFGPTRRHAETGLKSQAEGIIEQLTIYVWPKATSNETRLPVLTMLQAYGRSSDESPSRWATWAFSYLVLCFPELQQNTYSIDQRNGI